MPSTWSAYRSARRSNRRDFAKAIEDEPIAVIPFEPQIFGNAANNGQMISEIDVGPSGLGDVPDLAGAVPDGAWRIQTQPAVAASCRRSSASCCSDAPVGDRRRACSDGVPAPATPPRPARLRLPRLRRVVRRLRPWRRPRSRATVVRTAPLSQVRTAAAPPPQEPSLNSRHSEQFYEVKTQHLQALIEAIDLPQLAKLDTEFGARGNPRHRQRDHLDQEHRDVDLGAGGTARRHLQ